MGTAVMREKPRNRRTILAVSAVAAGMLGLSYASVPLYDLFCRVTGFGGTTQVGTEAPGAGAGASTREVRFNAHVTPGLEWRVEAPAGTLDLRPGEEVSIVYVATNNSGAPVTGTSSYNVTPNKIGPYFMKIECFCFTEQTLQPGETVEMPVVFYLDPEMDADINTRETPEITLSYVFFPVKKDEG